MKKECSKCGKDLSQWNLSFNKKNYLWQLFIGIYRERATFNVKIRN